MGLGRHQGQAVGQGGALGGREARVWARGSSRVGVFGSMLNPVPLCQSSFGGVF